MTFSLFYKKESLVRFIMASLSASIFLGRHGAARAFLATPTFTSVLRGGSEFSALHVQQQRFTTSTTIYSTAHAQPELLKTLIAPKLTQKSFGGLSYMDTRSATSKEFFRVLFVLGGPGAGKGTQSALMEEHYPTVHLSVGELLRNEQTKENSPFREIIQTYLVAGQIVPVEISLSLLQHAMREKEQQQGRQLIFLVDGFPRNYDNLNGWCDVMSEVAALWGVLVYQCPLNVLEERILKRAKDSGRSDDNLESLRKRFQTFVGETIPIVETLRDASTATAEHESSQWCVTDISGDQPLQDVWLATQAVLNQLILHDVVTANVALLESIENDDVTTYQSLCDHLWFEGKDVAEVMQAQEGKSQMNVRDAQLDVISGRHVALSYRRMFEGVDVCEKRIWMHQGIHGWRNVHFSRTP
ncbi:UMP-CMP kinase [Fistulifera solaris]|jgi:UMP-CMP kinase|uniref:UMP-CMP kinase n=1 Tax=Fistulifera solaris TaxID=1519565 RepID=A0A1Z5JTR4_FISSO|nr:UMP-CMP kinase [Fistulifera solaris]|eukprot:GAX17423.1 UMP-CMP kinase [Fistulifera solaris]